MDCKTSQFLLDYARPHAVDLAAEDLRALDDHLAQCPDCSAQAKNERRIDDHLARAMTAVEVPDRLRNHLLARLDAERGDWRRLRNSRIVRYATAVAACLLLAVAGAYGWSWYRNANRPCRTLTPCERRLSQETRRLIAPKWNKSSKSVMAWLRCCLISNTAIIMAARCVIFRAHRFHNLNSTFIPMAFYVKVPLSWCYRTSSSSCQKWTWVTRRPVINPRLKCCTRKIAPMRMSSCIRARITSG